MPKGCPECGIDLTGIDVKAHALYHWVESIPDLPEYREARKRQSQLLKGGVEVKE